jgi:hypothetical protein
MKMKLFVAAVAVLCVAATWPQLRITSFSSGGDLTWTNSAALGAYRVEWAESPTGQWKSFDTLTNLNLVLAKTNRITVQVPQPNELGFYRVAWLPPQPIGDWEYRGYDRQGALVVTGQLSITSTTLLSTNPPGYGVQGSWNLQYAGTETNAPWWLRIQTGTGDLVGTVEVDTARVRLSWPPGVYDDIIQLFGTLWPNTCTGIWVYVTFVDPQAGAFRMQRR